MLNVLGDISEDKPVFGKGGIPTGWNRSLWCNTTGATAEFNKILAGTKAKYLVLSYSSDSIIPVPTILKSFADNKWTVNQHTVAQKRFKSHNEGTQDVSELFEYLFCARKEVCISNT